MARTSFKTVESIGRTLPDVDISTAYGKPALKVRGKLLACIASHRSAEPNTLVVMMDTTWITRVSLCGCRVSQPTRCAI